MLSKTYIAVVCFTLVVVAFGAPPAPKPIKVVYEFGTPSRYDVLLSTHEPFVDFPSPVPKDYVASTKYTNYEGKRITYARLEVFQTGAEGSAIITEGAIGTSSLKISITANASLSYMHQTKLYTSPLQSNVVSIGKLTKNDVVLARVSGYEQYSQNRKAVKLVKFPGTIDELKDKKITYVVVTTTQTSDKLSAEITKGELNKSNDNFEVTLTADDTMELSYEVLFYTSDF